MLFIHVANREQFAGGIDGLDVAHAHAAGADDGAREDFTGRSETRAAQNVPPRPKRYRSLKKPDACSLM